MNFTFPSLLDPLLIAGLVCVALAAVAVARPARIRGLPGGKWLAAARLPLAVVGIVLVASTIFPSGTPLSNVPNPIARTVESVGLGQGVYLNNCASCHGVDARGGGPAAGGLPVRPPALVGPGSHLDHHTDGDLFYTVSNGLDGGMPAFGDVLADDEIWHVVNFLRSLKESPPGPASPETPTPSHDGHP